MKSFFPYSLINESQGKCERSMLNTVSSAFEKNSHYWSIVEWLKMTFIYIFCQSGSSVVFYLCSLKWMERYKKSSSSSCLLLADNIYSLFLKMSYNLNQVVAIGYI